MSNVSRGAYFKGRTRKWLIARGYDVADMEIVRWVYRPGGNPIPVKRDQFASDLIAMNAHGIVFIQVKGGKQAIGEGQFHAARRLFDTFVFPDGVQLWIVAWAPRVREPRIIVHAQRKDSHGKEEVRQGPTTQEGDGHPFPRLEAGELIAYEGQPRQGPAPTSPTGAGNGRRPKRAAR